MNVDKTLRELYEERKRLDRAIARLEDRLTTMNEKPARSTRGRKSMSPAERLQVSARMSAYWASRRAKSAAAGDGSSSDDDPPEPNGISA